MFTLYCLTFADGKRYIGQTERTTEKRMIEHRSNVMTGSNAPVHCAWRDQGSPSISSLGCFDTQAKAHAAERAAILRMDTLHPAGYNVSRGGKRPDIPWSDEMKAAAGERMKARWEKKKADGWVMPDSTKQKLSAKVFSAETRAKMSGAAKSRKREPLSQETCKKLSDSAKRKWQDEGHSAKRVESIKAAWNDANRAAMSEKAKETWLNPETRAKRIEAINAARAAKKQSI